MQANLFHEQILEESKRLLSAVPHSERGAVYTKTEVVEFMLNLSIGQKICPKTKILEPSFGSGNFLIPIVKRLISGKGVETDHIEDSIRGYELSEEDFELTRDSLSQILKEHGFNEIETMHLLQKWLIHDDFLLSEPEIDFTHAIGNPPYLRIEKIPSTILSSYRTKFSTLHDRADIYIAFFEQCLSCLSQGGNLTFICTDRWMKSKYGEKLRHLVTSKYNFDFYLDLCATSPFETDVTTYPAIFKISNADTSGTLYAKNKINRIQDINDYLPCEDIEKDKEYLIKTTLPPSSSPILLQKDASLDLLRKLESTHDLISDYCDISIGIATGADKVFIGKFRSDDFEEDSLVPMLKAKDINSGKVDWSGNYFLNPYEPNGELKDLDKYPKIKDYFENKRHILSKRHCAKKQPHRWYKTIDKFHHDLLAKPKLLVPDIRSNPKVVKENGNYYPHHNLYYIVSDSLDLILLGRILNSGIMNLFIRLYSTPMQGGCYRFQAQHLRKIRVPKLLKDYSPESSIDDHELLEMTYSLSSKEVDLVTSLSQ